jgi:diacylglycerol kinase
MKKVTIIILIAACFTMGFTRFGSEKNASSGLMTGITVEKAFASEIIPNTLVLHKQPTKDAPIFSWMIILYLSITVLGIVAFRRKTYF